MKFPPIVFRNLLRSRRRLLLTVLSIGISTFLFATLMSLPSAFNDLLRDQVSELRLVTINNAGMLYMLPRAQQNLIATMPHVEASSRYIATIAMYRGPREQIPIVGIEPNALAVRRPEWSIAPQARSALAEIPEAELVSAMLAGYKWRVGDTIILHHTFPLVGELSIRVVGRSRGRRRDGTGDRAARWARQAHAEAWQRDRVPHQGGPLDESITGGALD